MDQYNFYMFIVFIIIFFAVVQLLSVIQKKEQKRKLLQSGIYEVDKMDGQTFESYLATLFRKKGYKVMQTPYQGDYGADLILSLNRIKIAVQAKRYKSNVGIKAVQEVISAKRHYGANTCWVVTNSHFTKAAINLAKSNKVKLINRKILIQWMLETKYQKQVG